MDGQAADIHVVALLRSTASWAKFARELIRALRGLGVAVTAEDWPEAPFHDPALPLDAAVQRALGVRSQTATTLTFVSPEDYAALGIEPVRLWAFMVYEADRWPASWLRALDRVAGVVVPSQFCADSLMASGVPRERVAVVPPGVDRRVFRPAGRSPHEPGERLRLLFIGTPARRKGLDVLLRAFGAAFEPGDQVSLTVKTALYPDAAARSYVDDTWYDRVEALRRLGHDVRLILARLGEDRLADVFRRHDLLCFPTRAEGSVSLSTLEGMACGTPVVTTLVPGVRELEGCEGVRMLAPSRSIAAADVLPEFGGTDPRALVSEVSVEALAEELRWAYQHRPSLERMGAAASRESARWTWDHAARALCQGLGVPRVPGMRCGHADTVHP